MSEPEQVSEESIEATFAEVVDSGLKEFQTQFDDYYRILSHEVDPESSTMYLVCIKFLS
jgi:hypothetical protein